MSFPPCYYKKSLLDACFNLGSIEPQLHSSLNCFCPFPPRIPHPETILKLSALRKAAAWQYGTLTSLPALAYGSLALHSSSPDFLQPQEKTQKMPCVSVPLRKGEA